jgi:hypothetical protein
MTGRPGCATLGAASGTVPFGEGRNRDSMKRWLFPAALAVLIVGVGLTLAGNYGRDLVHDQLAAQKIKFAPYDQSGQNGDNYQAYPQLRDRAGTTVTDGLAARDFATYINAHVMEATDGRSYSEVSAAARANPEDQQLAEVRRTALDGQLLAAIMWNTYGWWLLATVAFFAGIALAIVGLALGLVPFLLGRGSEVPARAETPASIRA